MIGYESLEVEAIEELINGRDEVEGHHLKLK
jgi:hypothetical protein